MNRANLRDERGATMILFAIMLPTILILGAALVNIGNWWTHGRHLQTKVDAAAFAGAGVWGFPCGDPITGVSADIVSQARTYVGPHTSAAGVVQATGYNPQIGVAGADEIHVVLNGPDWWDDDPSTNPGDFTGDSTTTPPTPAGSVCEAKILDVKATEANSPPLFGFLPLWPDVKRKARIEIQEAEGVTGLLPIGVKIPRPLSAAAVFYDEQTGSILDAKYFCEDNTIFGLPPGLGGWSTFSSDPSCSFTSWASFNVAATTGVAIATSFRPRCGAGSPPAVDPCLDASPADIGTQVTDFCRQANGTVQCFYADPPGGLTQTVQSGLHFIRGYQNGNAGSGPPELRSAWLNSPSPAGCLGAYFASLPASSGNCTALLNANVDLGSYDPPGPQPETRGTPGDTEVRYKLIAGNTSDSDDDPPGPCGNNYNPNPAPGCDLSPSWSTTVTFDPAYARHAIAIRVRLKDTIINPGPGETDCGSSFTANCQWFFTSTPGSSTNPPTDATIFSHPVQRAFRGNLDRSGPIKWLRLTTDSSVPCDLPNGEAGSQPFGAPHCFFMEMGLQGGIAKDQDEPAIALNLGDNSSQRALLDCDDIPMSNITNEIKNGCTPYYATNPFTINNGLGPFCPNENSINGLLSVPKPPPFDDWPPYRCVITQTGTGNQVMFGFNQRLFGSNNAPALCPADNAAFVPGRNYWHDANNDFLDPVTNTYDTFTFAQDNPAPARGNRLRDDDPRSVSLFFTKYDSFVSTGNEVFEVVSLGNFYITGYGRTTGGGWQGGAPEDPCADGNVGNPLDGLPFGVGNEPPPDLDLGNNETWVWGHFVNDVAPNPNTTGGNGVLCNPGASFQPCVYVLVE